MTGQATAELCCSPPPLRLPVCTTELGEVMSHQVEFEQRNVKVLALSVDDVILKAGW